MKKNFFAIAVMAALLFSCSPDKKEKASEKKSTDEKTDNALIDSMDIDNKLAKYVEVKLTTDLSKLDSTQKELIPIFVEVAKITDELFWMQAYGDKSELLGSLQNEKLKRYVQFNYGPWDRLEGNEPFIENAGTKPLGANYYPEDMSKEEFESADIDNKKSLYTLIRRDSAGKLMAIPYSEAYAEKLQKASNLLQKAAGITKNEELKNYLNKRAEAFLSDEYYESDIAWMNMQSNTLDLITGPIETYEDKLFGYKAAFETYVLVKDKEWSQKLEKYAAMLPELQKNLPVEQKYKAEKPGSDSQLGAYDVIYYAGGCNAGGKTIAVNLPNDEKVQLEKGTRRLQLKNAMRAKFEKILLPISEILIDSSQRKYITFDAFFANTMFHEVAHGLGIKNTINNKGTVRQALKEHASALEEGKADVLGLYMITQLHEKGEITGDIKDYYTTFIASIFRSVRFGAASAHGKANMIRFNYFLENGAFTRNENGTYTINYEKMEEAMNGLSSKILMLQGEGDYEGVAKLVKEKGLINSELQNDLDRLKEAGIPVDVVFKQGVEVLGL